MMVQNVKDSNKSTGAKEAATYARGTVDGDAAQTAAAPDAAPTQQATPSTSAAGQIRSGPENADAAPVRVGTGVCGALRSVGTGGSLVQGEAHASQCWMQTPEPLLNLSRPHQVHPALSLGKVGLWSQAIRVMRRGPTQDQLQLPPPQLLLPVTGVRISPPCRLGESSRALLTSARPMEVGCGGRVSRFALRSCRSFVLNPLCPSTQGAGRCDPAPRWKAPRRPPRAPRASTLR